MSVLSALPDRVGGRFEVQRLLGRAVAVKVLRDTASGDRFDSEAQMLARARWR